MKKQFYSLILTLFIISTSQTLLAQFSWQQSAPSISGLATDENEGAALSFAADGNTFATTSVNNGNTQNLQGRVRIFTKSGSNWVQKGGNLVGAANGDLFGRSVALDSTGNTIVVGAPYNDAGFGNFSSAGHVRVFSWVSGAWVQKGATLLADSARDNFGYSVSISYDGNTVAIGSPFRLNKGRVKVYRWVSGVWVQLGANLDGTNNLDGFGNAVSLDRTGNILAIGAPFNGSGGSEAGQVKIFNWNGTAWTQRGGNINGSASDYSGTNLSLSANGNRVAIGSPQDLILGGFGIARVFDFNGTAWAQAGSSLVSPHFADAWGDAIHISGDGSRLAVGARADVPGNERGRAQVFGWSGTNWLAVGDTLKGDSAGNEFGVAVALSYTGNSLLVGATRARGSAPFSGLVRTYEYTNNTCVATNSTINPTQCGGTFTSPSGKIYTVSGTYRDTIQNVAGCDSIITIILTINSINTTITLNGNTFTAVDSTATYQWLDCANNNAIIPNATSRSLTAQGCAGQSFNYAVVLSKNGCVDTSACQQLSLSLTQQGQDINGEAPNDESGGSVSLSANGRVMAIGAIRNSGNGTNAGHVRVYAWNGTAWVQRGSDIDGEAADDFSGWSVSLSANGDVVAIGAISNDGNGISAGHVRVYAWNGTVWVQRGNDIDGESESDQSGFSVSLSANGEVVAIGAYLNDGNGTNAGHVRVYAWNGTAWVQRGADINGEAAADLSGWSVSLSANGEILAIGAPYNNGNGTYAGHVRVYAWNGAAWVQRGADINGEAANDRSGQSVSLSANGDVVAIGAPFNDGNGISAGHVRVYAWNGTAWVQRGADIDGEAGDDGSGESVSLSANGDILAVGAPFNDGNGSTAGHVRVYAWSGSAWVQRGADIDGEAANDRSGQSVSLSANGDVVAIGAPFNDGNGTNAGHVRVYNFCNFERLVVHLGPDRSICGSAGSVVLDAGNPGSAYLWSTGATTQTITVTSTGTYFVKVTNGTQMAFDTVIITVTTINKNVTLNGNTFTAVDSTATYQWLDCANNNAIIPNATSRSLTVQGCAGQSFNYAVVLSKNGCVDTSACQLITVNWGQVGLDINGEAIDDQSGYSVSLSADGKILAVGARGNSNNAGHVRVYAWNGAAWVQRGSDIDGEAVGDRSGSSVSLSANGEIVAIGAPLNRGNLLNSGHVRVYAWNGTTWVQRGNDIDGEVAQDQSGYSVSISANGDIVAIGAILNDGNGDLSGHVRVYVWNDTAWVQRGNDIDGEVAYDQSGYSVSISANGDIVAIGAPYNDGNDFFSGHVRVYAWNGTVWVQRGNDIDGESESDESGSSVSLSANGEVVAIGAYLNDGNGNNAGHVRVYAWNGTAWVQRGADIDGEAGDDGSGESVSLSANGDILAVGAPFNDGNGSTAGHVRVYAWSGSAWVQRGADIDGEAANDRSGWPVSLSANGEVVAIGAYLNDGNGNNAGHVRVYKQCTFAVGIEEQSIVSSTADNNKYRVYPNPTTGLFRIKTEGNETVQSVSVYNSVGELVLNQHITANDQELDMQNQPVGIYFVRITTTNGYSTQRLVIQH